MIAADVTLSNAALGQLAQEFEAGKGLYLKVGILGDYAGRTPDESGTKRKKGSLTNPELGAIHEFGSIKRKIPERSFLRLPILTQLPSALANVDWVRFIQDKGVFGALDEIGNLCVGIVSRAFATGGFGQWAAWSYRYAKFRERLARSVLGKRGRIGPVKPGLILVLSGQLQSSVTYAVVREGSPTSPIYPI